MRGRQDLERPPLARKGQSPPKTVGTVDHGSTIKR
jgi:hypothetical protein